VRIALIVEGQTEKAFLPALRVFLQIKLEGRMPRFDVLPHKGRIPTGNKLRNIVIRLLEDQRNPANAVIALTDVYTGANPPEFNDAADAKNKMREWVNGVPNFYPHAAQYEFEAWLLPYWLDIQKLAGSNKNVPGANPEDVNHIQPPSKRLQELFRTGSKGRSYIKTRDAGKILRNADLIVAIQQCGELKSFVNTILNLCGESPIP
jgi:hypothetical protein